MTQATKPSMEIAAASFTFIRAPPVCLFLNCTYPEYSAATAVPIYSISTFPDAATVALLDNLALNTRGKHIKITDTTELRRSVDMITVSLRNFYVLTFQSTNTYTCGSLLPYDRDWKYSLSG